MTETALCPTRSDGSAARQVLPTARPLGLSAVVGLAVVADLVAQQWTHQIAPGLFLLPAVIAVAVAGGTAAGYLAAAAVVVFAAVDLSAAGPLWAQPFDRAVRLAVLAVSAPAAAVLVGWVRRRGLAVTAQDLCRRVQAERDRADAQCQAAASERDALRQQRDTLAAADRETQRRLADLIAAVPGVVWEMVVDGPRLRVAFISRYVQDLLGYDAQRWTGSDELWSAAVHPDDRARVARWLAEACGTGATAAANAVPIEFRWLARDGSTVWVETRLSAVPSLSADPSAGPGCVAIRGVTSDITARKQLEAAREQLEADLQQRANELADVARQLRASNAELDQFAYSASHDLKAPLRGIANLSNWIEEDLGPDRLTPDARRQFDLLRGRVHRMDRLIDGLLAYSQVGRTAGSVEWVDLNQLMSEVADWVGPPPNVHVTAGPDLPAFNADRLRLAQVLVNLVGNAVKHHGPGDGTVRVTVEAAGDWFAFAVTDDGPGIDPKYHDKIFGVFQTLQRRDKVEGTGIGLALVRKVVASKGGTASVESAVGRGATFRFTWPKVDPSVAAAVPAGPPVAADQPPAAVERVLP